MKKQIKAEIIADSVCPRGHRITTFILTYPRIIHGELMTHRMFSRNAASSRAIPFNKMVKEIEEDPFIPIAWQKNHKGMQGTEYQDNKNGWLDSSWLVARDNAIYEAKDLYSKGVTKQLCNRLLEPFQWMTTLVTATQYDGFFELRCPKYKVDSKIYNSKKDFSHITTLTKEGLRLCNKSQAEIHIQALAESMWDQRNESEPKELSEGQWHVPFGDRIDDSFMLNGDSTKIKVATARAARISYTTHDGEIDYEKDIALHDMLLESRHASPFEHCARVPTNEEYNSNMRGELDVDGVVGWFDNFKGWQSYRNTLGI